MKITINELEIGFPFNVRIGTDGEMTIIIEDKDIAKLLYERFKNEEITKIEIFEDNLKILSFSPRESATIMAEVSKLNTFLLRIVCMGEISWNI